MEETSEAGSPDSLPLSVPASQDKSIPIRVGLVKPGAEGRGSKKTVGKKAPVSFQGISRRLRSAKDRSLSRARETEPSAEVPSAASSSPAATGSSLNPFRSKPQQPRAISQTAHAAQLFLTDDEMTEVPSSGLPLGRTPDGDV
jgi:hypothetical protein